MSNSWFQFKQFTINQDKTSMKVGTDGVLLGAWADFGGARLKENYRVLDVGTGTGLIAIMAAQRYTVDVTGVELDEEASKQASDNFRNTAWADRLRIVHGDFRQRNLLSSLMFDHIVCNPPFFKDSLRASGSGRNLARHDETLSLHDLISQGSDLLQPNGLFSLILPIDRFEEAHKLMFEKSFFLNRKTTLRSHVESKPIRVLAEWSPEKLSRIEGQLCIYEGISKDYTQEYISLVKEFYLNL